MHVPFTLPGTVNTTNSPAPVVLSNGEVVVFYKGAVGDGGIYVTRTTAPPIPGQWTNAQRLPSVVNTSAGPGALFYQNQIYVTYTGSGNDATTYILKSGDSGITWSMTNIPGLQSANGPSLFVSGSTIYVLTEGAAGDENIFIAPLVDPVWTPVS